MLSHDMEKLLTFATERQTALMQEAAVAHLLNQQKKSGRYMVTWPQALRYWWQRLTFLFQWESRSQMERFFQEIATAWAANGARWVCSVGLPPHDQAVAAAQAWQPPLFL